VRNIVRAIEYGMGQDGYFLEHEWTTYVFDAAPMAVVLATCMLWYNSGVGQRPGRTSLESLSSIPL
jgi:RTA1 like protein